MLKYKGKEYNLLKMANKNGRFIVVLKDKEGTCIEIEDYKSIVFPEFKRLKKEKTAKDTSPSIQELIDSEIEFDDDALEELSAMNYELLHLQSINCIPNAQEFNELMDFEDENSIVYIGEYLAVNYYYDIPEKPLYSASANKRHLHSDLFGMGL